MSVRRAEERGPDQLVGFTGVCQELFRGGEPALQMIERVIAHAVAAIEDILVEVGVLAHVVAHAEKGGFNGMIIQNIKHPRRDLRDGAVVEGEVHRLLKGNF